jgi:hypothetical protein
MLGQSTILQEGNMGAEDWIGIAGIIATISIAVAGFVINERRERLQRMRQPHIQFRLDCNFYGPEGDAYIAEVLLIASNQGRILQKFKKITLRIRGIENNQPLAHWEDHEPRLKFPAKIVEDVPIIPPRYNYFFVEPGVEQKFTYITKIPASVKYILVYAEFFYDPTTPQSTERVFQVK